MSKALITGGSGFLGRLITKKLIARGWEVAHLSRKEDLNQQVKSYGWNPVAGFINEKALEGVAGIIHLAGCPVVEKRWTKERKQEIIDSRVKSAELLIQSIQRSGINPSVFVGASATGYYGSSTKQVFLETDKPGNDFLASTCVEWEKPYASVAEQGIRTAIVRVGVVLGRGSGALEKMTKLTQLGLASAVGDGKQMIPWIHEEDVSEIFVRVLEQKSMSGIYNAVAPYQVSNLELSKALARAMNKPFFMPAVPAFVLRAIFGEMASAFLDGANVSCRKIQDNGYNFRYPVCADAIRNLVKK